MSKTKRIINMTDGHLLKNMMLFALPLMVSNLLQRLFNTADTMVIGQFSGPTALAAVGGTAPVLGLFVWGLIGISVGADVIVSKMIGMQNKDGIHKAVHTSYFLSLIIGMAAVILGEVLTVPLLNVMSVPEEVMPLSVLYLRIYYLGLFFTIVYNFGAAVLRSSGDSTRPTIYLAISGLINVVLNICFVYFFKLDVAGVAWATVISQVFAAVAVTVALIRETSDIRLTIRDIRPSGAIVRQIISVGIPSCIQNMLFSVSNIVVQGAINSFGSITMAANSAATNLEEYVYVVTSAVSQTNITFTGQNNGAGKPKNIRKILIISVLMVSIMGFAVGLSGYVFGNHLMKLFTSDPEVIRIGLIRLNFVAVLLFINGIVDIIGGSMRGMGFSFVPMVVSLAGICGFRLIYIYTIFPQYGTLQSLLLCYPISWTLTAIIQVILWLIVFRNFKKKLADRTSAF